jgi:hypothetical protein
LIVIRPWRPFVPVACARGGLRYFPILRLDVASMTFVRTEADDIAGTEKTCFKIPCR